VAASGTLTVTMTNDASMTWPSGSVCGYVLLDAVADRCHSDSGAATATTNPATDSWTI